MMYNSISHIFNPHQPPICIMEMSSSEFWKRPLLEMRYTNIKMLYSSSLTKLKLSKTCMVKIYLLDQINPYHAKFLTWNDPPCIFGTVHYYF